MVQPQSSEDDDLSPEPREARDEENFEPGDDSDLGLGDELEDKVDADTDAGLDEALDAETGIGEEESGSWLDDGAEPAIEVDAGDDGAEDDGDGTGTEPAADTLAEDWEDDFGFDEGGGTEIDSGEEGFGDESLLSGLELEQLPPLDDQSAPDDETSIENDPLTADLIAELASRSGGEEAALVELAQGLTCVRLDAALVQVERVQHSGRPLRELCNAGATGVAFDGATLLVAETAAQLPIARELPADALLKLAASDGDPPLIALATPDGIACSRDLGRSFAPPVGLPNAPGPVAALAFGRGSVDRVFAAPAAGPLYASDDAGASFRCALPEARVLRIAADGDDGVLVLARGEHGAARALRSSDGGATFVPLALPVHEPERVQDLQLAGDVALCSRRAPLPQLLLWSAREPSWSPVVAARAPALLLHEGDSVRLYFCVGGGREAWLVRLTAFGEGLPQLVCELPADAGMALQLAGHHHEGVTCLQLGTERAWYRIAVGREGSRR